MTATQRVELRDVRVAGALLLAAGAVRAATHSSIGIPCPLRTLTGIPCPLCGMTTSVTAVARGRLVDAVAANPAGVVAVLVAIVLIVRPRLESVDLPRWLLPAGLAVMWVWQLVRVQVL